MRLMTWGFSMKYSTPLYISPFALFLCASSVFGQDRYQELLQDVFGKSETMADAYGNLPSKPDGPTPKKTIADELTYWIINEIDNSDEIYKNLGGITTTETTTTTTITNDESFPFLQAETQMQSNLAGSTTGLTSPIGGARTQREMDELHNLLAATPDGPFVATVESPSGVSTGDFTGEEGLNIAGVLNVFAFDSGSLQDGDRVRLTVRDSRGIVLSKTITLTFGGQTSRVSARRGLVNVTIRALNEGSSPPNTGGLRVSGDVAGSRSGNFNLTTGGSGTLAVRVLGN